MGSRDEDSDDASGNGTLRKSKAEAALTARQAELLGRDKDKERERARLEAASRRQERARGRRTDGKHASLYDTGDTSDHRPDADAAEETTPKPTPSARTSPPQPSSQPGSPPAEKASHKRGPGKKPGKKLGNNQYTKSKYEKDTSSPHGRRRHLPGGSGSGDEASEGVTNGDSTENHTNGASKNSPPLENGNGVGKGKFGRGKKAGMNGNNAKMQADNEPVERTFTNMHAALSHMTAYMERHSAELREAGLSPDGGLLGGAVQTPDLEVLEDKPIEEMTAAQLAAKLQKGILNWQQQWGHLAGSNVA